MKLKMIMAGYGGFYKNFNNLLKNKDLYFPYSCFIDNIDFDKIYKLNENIDVEDLLKDHDAVYAKNKYREVIFQREDFGIGAYNIVEIDTSRPWTISYHDGSTYVKYLDYDVVDGNINYCEFK